MEKKNRKFKQYIKYIILDILIAAVVSVLLITYVASAYKIEGNSMQTALYDQDRIIISKWSIRTAAIRRYDIVVLRKPDEPRKSIIKRVIGLPGETIEIKKGNIFINGRQLPEPYLKKEKDLMFRSIRMKERIIPKDHFFVAGDNRTVSQDSRIFGPVPIQYIYGRTIFRYWPLAKIGKVE